MISLIYGIENMTQMNLLTNRNRLTESGFVTARGREGQGRDRLGAWG